MTEYIVHDDPTKMLTEAQMKYVVQDAVSPGLIVVKYNQESGIVTCGGSRHFWEFIRNIMKEFFQVTPQYIARRKLGKKTLKNIKRSMYESNCPNDVHTQNNRVMYRFELERNKWFEIQKTFDNNQGYTFIPVKSHGRII